MNTFYQYCSQTVNRFLGTITMYRLLLYGLDAILLAALIVSALGLLAFSPLQLLISSIIFGSVSFGVNKLLGRLYGVQQNIESAFITGLILTVIVAPPENVQDALVIALIAAIAQVSKYILAYKGRHLFNPAGAGVFVAGLVGLTQASWWVGTAALLPITLIFGLLVLKKMQRFQLFGVFLAAVLIVQYYFTYTEGRAFIDVFAELFTSWPLVFFGTIMLTEPFTSPSRKRNVLAYGAIAGVLFASRFQVGPLFATPEVALIIANLFAFMVNAKGSYRLTLKEIQRSGSNYHQLIFTPQQPVPYQAGQFMEWTLPHKKSDTRGVRRYFTIASSPTEDTIQLGFKTTPTMSSFKKSLLALKPGAELTASNLGGDFVLPADNGKRLVFIAGGVGVTPFRSMIKSLIDTNQKRDVTLFYLVTKAEDVMYADIFEDAKLAGVKTIYVLTSVNKRAPSNRSWEGETGSFDIKMLKKYVSHPQNATYYVSGPGGMLRYTKTVLKEARVRRGAIHTDYFSGY